MTPAGVPSGPDRASRGGVSIVTDNERGRSGGEVLRGRLVAGVRLIFVALLATVGARIGGGPARRARAEPCSSSSWGPAPAT